MPASVIKAITKVELAKLVINEFGVDDSWLPTDDELSLAIKTQQLKSNCPEVPVGSMSYKDVMDEFFRLDTKTKRLIQDGFVVNCGEAYFYEEADAVEYLNKSGLNCTSFAVTEDGYSYEDLFTCWCEWD